MIIAVKDAIKHDYFESFQMPSVQFNSRCTAAFSYYYGPAIFVDFQRPSSEKVRFKNVYGLLLYIQSGVN